MCPFISQSCVSFVMCKNIWIFSTKSYSKGFQIFPPPFEDVNEIIIQFYSKEMIMEIWIEYIIQYL